jgi:hypothetical protein
MISSAHCGNIRPMLLTRGASFFAGNVLELFKSFGFNPESLQRPLPVDEFDVDAGDAVGAGAA